MKDFLEHFLTRSVSLPVRSVSVEDFCIENKLEIKVVLALHLPLCMVYDVRWR